MIKQKKEKAKTLLNTGEEFEHDISIRILWDTDKQQYAIESNLAIGEVTNLLDFLIKDLTDTKDEDEDEDEDEETPKEPKHRKVGGTVN